MTCFAVGRRCSSFLLLVSRSSPVDFYAISYRRCFGQIESQLSGDIINRLDNDEFVELKIFLFWLAIDIVSMRFMSNLMMIQNELIIIIIWRWIACSLCTVYLLVQFIIIFHALALCLSLSLSPAFPSAFLYPFVIHLKYLSVNKVMKRRILLFSLSLQNNNGLQFVLLLPCVPRVSRVLYAFCSPGEFHILKILFAQPIAISI